MHRARTLLSVVVLLSLFSGFGLSPGNHTAGAAPLLQSSAPGVQTPTTTPRPSCTSTATVSSTGMTVSVTCASSMEALIDVEIYAAGGNRVHQTVFDREAFVAGQPRSFSIGVDATLAPGAYVLKVGGFSPGW